MEANMNMLRKQFAALHDVLAGIEHGKQLWHHFWPLLADLQSVIQQRQPGGSLAADAWLELDKAKAPARARDVEGVRVAVQNAAVTLKLADTPR